ncbi:uncharacterized protein EDB93DRAFT_1089992 [Suillus bovinus]|uniref:uncharacterized protein n=1 Tax=Suillus bovinus TaxID=48563 RepID=UPI001B8671A0|nr:uncharacterized protein EDB93DRAFT_1089992 [Suillus bovinus]KAG2139802.1 hypothetical protein EDB93DRAFT_1089992 [Suillus bovinus]
MRTTSKPQQRPITTKTNLSTPGHEFPGSYPREHEQELQEQSRGDGSDGPAAGTSVVQAAKQYMPEPVERTVEYAGQAAATYLPIPQGVKKSVASYWCCQPKGTQSELEQQLSTSLPSSELKGAQPHEHVGGVGSLPGTISESSVALLPDERAEQDAQRQVNLTKDESQTRGDNQVKSATHPFGAAAVTGKPGVSTTISAPRKAFLNQSPCLLITLRSTKCWKDTMLRLVLAEAPIGAAQICDQPPGKTTETKAATTAKAKVSQQPGDEKLTQIKGVDSRTGDVGKVAGDRGSDEDMKHTHKAGARTGAYDTDYHPAKLHPPPVGESASQAKAQPDSPVSPASAPPASVTSSKEHRVSFMDKLRGEAKVIAGKMTGKEDKVEEGKRIMHGEV